MRQQQQQQHCVTEHVFTCAHLPRDRLPSDKIREPGHVDVLHTYNGTDKLQTRRTNTPHTGSGVEDIIGTARRTQAVPLGIPLARM